MQRVAYIYELAEILKPLDMKSILLLLSVIYLIACGQNTNQQPDKNIIDKEVLNQIKSHYQTEYGKGARLEETNSDSVLQLVYHNIPKDTNDYDGFLIDISIPKKVKMNLFAANPILYGDLNNDKIDDMVISVHTEGGGGGGNVWSQDLFVFQINNGKYEITSITPDGDISGCQSGTFRATEIKNGFLIGNSSCYKDEDPRCCPSLEYITKVELSNKNLKFNSKTKTK